MASAGRPSSLLAVATLSLELPFNIARKRIYRVQPFYTCTSVIFDIIKSNNVLSLCVDIGAIIEQQLDHLLVASF